MGKAAEGGGLGGFGGDHMTSGSHEEHSCSSACQEEFNHHIWICRIFRSTAAAAAAHLGGCGGLVLLQVPGLAGNPPGGAGRRTPGACGLLTLLCRHDDESFFLSFSMCFISAAAIWSPLPPARVFLLSRAWASRRLSQEKHTVRNSCFKVTRGRGRGQRSPVLVCWMEDTSRPRGNSPPVLLVAQT